MTSHFIYRLQNFLDVNENETVGPGSTHKAMISGYNMSEYSKEKDNLTDLGVDLSV
jgi:hypothetical protein